MNENPLAELEKLILGVVLAALAWGTLGQKLTETIEQFISRSEQRHSKTKQSV